MSGNKERLCDIDRCPNCNYDVLTWPFGRNDGGHYNIDKNSNNRLNNTVFLLGGRDFSDIKMTYCYNCGREYHENSLLFKAVISKAKEAIITRE